jgi:hypothetical protein
LEAYDTAAASTTPVSQQTNPFPDQVFGGVGSFLKSTGWANYESLQVKLIRAFNNGLAYNAAFTWSQTLAFSSCQGDFSNQCIQNIYDYTGDYGPSFLNVPLIFTFNANYALPFGKGRPYLESGVASKILGNWQVNTILAIRSGLPINPTNGGNSDTANTGNGSGNQRVNILFNPEKGAPHKRTEWFNPAAFALPANGTFGNGGINSLHGPGYWNDDLSVFRDIPITEKYRLQFRAEAFDVFNHPNLGQPDSGGGSGYQLGYAGTAVKDGVTTYPNGFNVITNTVPSTGPGAGRALQLALKLLF